MSNLLTQTKSQAFILIALELNEAELEHNRIYPLTKTARIKITANFDLNLYSVYAEIRLKADDIARILSVDAVDVIALARSNFLGASLGLLPSEYELSDEVSPNITDYGFDTPIETVSEAIGALPLASIPVYRANPYNITIEIDMETLTAFVFATIPFLPPQIKANGVIYIEPLSYP